MMNIRKLADGLYIAPQLTQADMADIAECGICSVICNRPDQEESSQPDFEQVRQWLADIGITQTAYQPVSALGIEQEDIAQFQALLQSLPVPILIYCRSGTRSTLLWAYVQIGNGMPVDEAMAVARQAGIDLSRFEYYLRQLAALSE